MLVFIRGNNASGVKENIMKITYKKGQAFYNGTIIGVFHDRRKPNDWFFDAPYGVHGKTRKEAIENTIKERKRLFTMADVKTLNKECGNHFFDRDTKRFFKSTIETTLLKGGYFITSESQSSYTTGRRYTVRKVDYLDGSIHTVGEFQEHSSKQLAKLAINMERS